VSGLTKKHDQLSRGRTRLTAASRAVSGLQPRAWNLAAQHAELVAQHEDLQVLAGVAAAEQGEQLDGAAQRQVGEFRQHQVGLYMDEEDQGTES